MRSSRRNEDGFTMVPVLILLVFISSLAMLVDVKARSQVQLAKKIVLEVHERHAKNSLYTLLQPVAVGAFFDQESNQGQITLDGNAIELEYASISFNVRLLNDEALPNLLLIPSDRLEKALKAGGSTMSVEQAVNTIQKYGHEMVSVSQTLARLGFPDPDRQSPAFSIASRDFQVEKRFLPSKFWEIFDQNDLPFGPSIVGERSIRIDVR